MEKKEGQKTERTENKEETKDEKKEDKTKEQKSDNNQNNSNQSKTVKAKKYVFLNQKAILPNNLPDRIEYIRELFYNEELGYTVNYAPLNESSTTYDIGKYFKLKQKTIFEIASSILFYIFKKFEIKPFTSKEDDESKRDPTEILKSE